MRTMSLVVRDVRVGGRWSLAQRAKNDAIYALAMTALAGCRMLPRRALDMLTARIAKMANVLARRDRERAIANVVRVLGLSPLQARVLVRECFDAMGEMLADSIAALVEVPATLPMSAKDRAVIANAVAEGRGVVLPSAHLGPWERVAATLVNANVPLVTLVRESYDPRFDRVLGRIRDRAGVRSIPRGSPHAAMHIVRALRRGAVLGAPMDLKSRVPSVRVPFLGVPADTAVGPARIALRAKAPVVVASLEVVRGKRMVTAKRLDSDDLDPADPTSALTLTTRINDELSRRILTAPALWPWMHPRWD
jgi:Kdo2-lipid IVA lauroyltransferase/acyltransferase